MMKPGVISPQDWGLPVSQWDESQLIDGVGLTAGELLRRSHACLYEWAPRHFDVDAGAFYGFYRAPDQHFEPPQTVNLIAPWLLIAGYDRFQDAQMLDRAQRAADWFYAQFVVSHPMSVVIGGVRERWPDGELWTKFAAEYAMLAAALHQRTQKTRYRDQARISGGFLIQSARYGFAPRYNEPTSSWQSKGWQSFGRAVEACIVLHDLTGEARWWDQALAWGNYGLSLLADDGGLYLIDDDYFNTDIAADELRAFVFLYESTQDLRYHTAAQRFADWLLAHQRADGAWPLTIDRDGNVVVETVGPGDMPNIAIALLRLHALTQQQSYLDAAQRAIRYGLSTQIIPGGDQPYADDPNMQWGFWSWDPFYDYTASGDQATHHVRGVFFLLDYLASRNV